MNLCLDFSAIKSGGGLQLATSFLSTLNEIELPFSTIIVPEGSALQALVRANNRNEIIISCPIWWARRLFFERASLQSKLNENNVSRIFTFFGAGIPHDSRVRSLVSVAYPIICYPESSFWRFAPKIYRSRQRIINLGRVKRLEGFADSLIAETNVMASRLRNTPGLTDKRIHVIPPAPSSLVPFNESPAIPDGAECRFLFLSGLNFHKNLWRLPEIAESLLALHCTSFRFVITANESDFINHCKLMGSRYVSQNKREKYFEFIGAIPPNEVWKHVDSAHYLVNLSDLESFTNNYMEAWRRGRPLVASDRDFAQELLGDSAILVEPHDPESAAFGFLEAVTNFRTQLSVSWESRRVRLEKFTAPLAERVGRIKELIKEL